jgi:hypothetical protein
MKTYARRKEQSRAIHARQRAAARDIYPIPPVADRARRRAARRSFRFFCEAYQPRVYSLPWSADHLRVIGHIERAVSSGTLVAFAMPRGSGKTSLAESAVLWGTLTGLVPYAVLIGATEGAAAANLQSIHAALVQNETLAADFPQACVPLRKLEGIHQRKLLYNGAPITYSITASRIVLPSIPGSTSSAAVIETIGLTGSIRGRKYQHPDGRAIRPALVLIDDPQTDESARSPAQCAAREAILAGAVLGLAGPGRKIAGVMPCTVIAPGDLADTMLDRSKHPDWHGERTRLVYDWPASPLWEDYARIRAEALTAGDPLAAASTAFYAAHRAEMDEGAAVAWEARHNPDELSAIQHAYNLKLRDEAAFASEYQNDPRPEAAFADELTPLAIAARTTGRPRRTAPVDACLVTAFIDVQATCLYWLVAAWAADFSAVVVDYGTYPDQGRAYFALVDVKRTLARAAPGTGLEGSIRAGLDALTRNLAALRVVRDDGAELAVDRILIDANWSVSTQLVYAHCKASPWAALLLPAHGRYVGASSLPMADWRRHPGDRVGLNWRLPALLAPGPYGGSCTTRIIGSLSYTPALPCPWATAAGSACTGARGPRITGCSPISSRPNTGSRRSGGGVRSTSGNIGPIGPTTITSTV